MTGTGLPDGLWIKWAGRVRRAWETVEPAASVLVKLEAGEQVAARYERDDGAPDWVYVPERELEELFRLKTWARWQGMRCPVDRRIGADRILLSTPLMGAERAAALGLTPTLERGIYAAEVPLADVTELVQERMDIPRG